MGARESSAMAQARKLVIAGHSAYSAAKMSGITKQAIYMSNWYREFKKCQIAKLGDKVIR